MSFNKKPSVRIKNEECVKGWADISQSIKAKINNSSKNTKVIVIECYQGVYRDQVAKELSELLSVDLIISEDNYLLDSNEITSKTKEFITDDRIFGKLNDFQVSDYLDPTKVGKCKNEIAKVKEGVVLIIGTGASLIVDEPDVLVYADMARWEIQMRMRNNEVSNIGRKNENDGIETKYKIGFFLDWRACDRLKKDVLPNSDFIIDTNTSATPLLLETRVYLDGLSKAASQPFSVVPFFDPGPWGGEWMRNAFDLDKDQENFAWCFNCVPEENSILFEFDNGEVFESPSLNVVFFETINLIGDRVFDKFGAEFPIRFDFLDTVEGGNLSLQVHPSKEYIKKEFGLDYTQDESYYMLDATDEALVYLGVKSGINPNEMISDLQEANKGNKDFDADKYTVTWPTKKHDHYLIPNGTVHCSATGCMVLEISATPYIFTFKLWDWGRLGLDGRPRPINVERGKEVIKWDYDEKWVEDNLLNNFDDISSGDGWREERTGLHETQFIETRRHWFTKAVTHKANGSVHVFNLVEGDEVTVSSPTNAFQDFKVNYAETFIVPASIQEYIITPSGKSIGKEVATIKAYVRN